MAIERPADATGPRATTTTTNHKLFWTGQHHRQSGARCSSTTQNHRSMNRTSPWRAEARNGDSPVAVVVVVVVRVIVLHAVLVVLRSVIMLLLMEVMALLM